jgi:hypothetical protein
VHNLIHQEYMRAVADEAQRHRNHVNRPHGPGPPPPKRVRSGLAVLLAAAASRVDREAARRAVA